MFSIFSVIILSNSSFCATVNQFFQSPTSPENTNNGNNVLKYSGISSGRVANRLDSDLTLGLMWVKNCLERLSADVRNLHKQAEFIYFVSTNKNVSFCILLN